MPINYDVEYPILQRECQALRAQRDALKTLVDLQDKLLICYRVGKNPGSIIDKLHKAKADCAALDAMKEMGT